MSDAFEYKDMGLEALIKAVNTAPKAKVGVLGNTNARAKDAKGASLPKTNSEIGLIHEFGSSGMPQRSFLRMPLTDQLNIYINKSNFLTNGLIKKIIESKTLFPMIDRLGIIGVRVVLDAFNTGGFGKWKASNMEYKKTKQTLVETQQLMRSIEHEVVE